MPASTVSFTFGSRLDGGSSQRRRSASVIAFLPSVFCLTASFAANFWRRSFPTLPSAALSAASFSSSTG